MNNAHLIVLNGPERGRRIALDGAMVVVGRDASASVVVDHPKVSRRHATVEPMAHGIRLVDLGSRNGTHVNGTRVDDCLLAPGDEVAIGPLRMRFVADTSTQGCAEVDAGLSGTSFDLPRLAERLATWALDWGAAAVSLRFRRLGRLWHVHVADAAGRRLLVETTFGVPPDSFDDLGQALEGLARRGHLDESHAYDWINGTRGPRHAAAPDSVPTEANIDAPSDVDFGPVTWSPISDRRGWWVCARSSTGFAVGARALEAARSVLAERLSVDHSVLTVAIPERAVRAGDAIDGLVVLEGCFTQAGTRVHESRGTALRKSEFQARARDAATHLLVWTALGALDPTALAREAFRRATDLALALFDGREAPHDPANWSDADRVTHAPALYRVALQLLETVATLGGQLDWPDLQGLFEGTAPRWLVYVAKAQSHHALHPLMVLSQLAGWGSDSVHNGRNLREAIRPTRPSRAGDAAFELLAAFTALAAAERESIESPAILSRPHDLLFLFDLAVTDSPDALARAVLFGPEADAAPRHHTARAFSALRQLAEGVSVEVATREPARLGVSVRFARERYS